MPEKHVTITEFLEARIAEDERDAEKGWDHNGTGVFARDNYGCLLVKPARVLAECTAKRAIIQSYQSCQHAEAEAARDVSRQLEKFGVKLVASGLVKGMELAVKHLAAIYASHEDYDKEWGL